MPSIEPGSSALESREKATDTNEGSNIGNVVNILDRMANVAERENEVSTSNSTSNYPQVIVVHFIKNKYDLPMPVGITNFDVPLIELVKEIKSSNKYFFLFQ